MATRHLPLAIGHRHRTCGYICHLICYLPFTIGHRTSDMCIHLPSAIYHRTKAIGHMASAISYLPHFLPATCTQVDHDLDVFQAAEDFGFDDEVMDRLAAAIDPDRLEANSQHLQTMADFARHPAAVFRDPIASVNKGTNDLHTDLKEAPAKLRNMTLQNQLRAMDDDKHRQPEAAMQIRYDTSGRATCAVVTMLPRPDVAPSAIAQTIVSPGQPMPYIRLPDAERPTTDATVRLHKLSSEQEFAFRLIMDTLDKHVAKENNIPQLTMSVLGNAGMAIHNLFSKLPIRVILLSACSLGSVAMRSGFPLLP